MCHLETWKKLINIWDVLLNFIIYNNHTKAYDADYFFSTQVKMKKNFSSFLRDESNLN